MKLSELNPKYVPVNDELGYLSFDNPLAEQIAEDKRRWARIRSLPILRNGVANPEDWSGPIWTFDGSPETEDWDSLTLQPSIWFMQNEGVENGEWHGFITKGEIVTV